MFKKGLLASVLSVLMMVCCAIGLTACEKECVHSFGDYVVTKDATCLEAGTQQRTCTSCGLAETATIQPLGHDWDVASCTAPKTCKKCSATEGASLLHTYNQEVVKDEALKSQATCTSPAVYFKSCTCGAISENEQDVFTNGSALSHVDANFDHVCDRNCGEEGMGVHADSPDDNDHLCEYCNVKLNECVDDENDGDHDCDVCGETGVSSHDYSSATCNAPKTCTDCGATDGSTLGHIDQNFDHICDRNCGKENMGTHADDAEDDDHLCDYCNAKLNDCVDDENDGDHDCDVCGEIGVTSHDYSSATCNAPKTCTDCGATEGSKLSHLDANFDHICDRNCGKEDIGTHADSPDDDDHLCEYCNAKLNECVDDENDGDHDCDVCGEKGVTSHDYSSATCNEPKTCTDCGATDGNALGHIDNDFDHICDRNCGKEDMGTHADASDDDNHVCDYGCGQVLENCSDIEGDNDHDCDVCGKKEVSAHDYGDATCGTPATCFECGATTGTTASHIYNQSVVKTQALKTPATCTSPAVYFKSCTCGAVSDKDVDTFTDGSTLSHIDDNFDHVCDRNCGKKDMGTHADASDDDDHVCDYGCGQTLENCLDIDGDNNHDCDICGEKNVTSHDYSKATCEEAKTCTECGATDGNALGHTDNDFDHICDRNCGKQDVGTHADDADDDDHVCDYGCGQTLESCSDIEGDNDHDCDICGERNVSLHDYSNATCNDPKTCTECGATEGNALGHIDENFDHICDRNCGKEDMGKHEDDGDDDNHVCDYGCGQVLENCSDIEGDNNHDCDVCGRQEVSAHDYGEATCGAPATCFECGATTGTTASHIYNQTIVKEEALKSEATCTSLAVYYKSCTCGAVSENELDTFTTGSTSPHVYTLEEVKEQALKSEATCTSPAVYFKSCTCGAISERDSETFTNGLASDHTYNQKIVKEEALKSEATCTSPAVYFKSCICGAVSTNDGETFNSGSALPHSHLLVSSTSATCNSPTINQYRCSCGDEYTEEDGSALGHDIAGATAVERQLSGCEYVLVYQCQRQGCGCEVLGEKVWHHTHVASITAPATCIKDGQKTLVCACGDTKTEIISKDATGHNWEKGSVVDGVRTDKCSYCQQTKTVTVYEGTKTDSTNASDLKDTEIELNDANISLDSGVIDAIGDQEVTVSADKLEGEDRKELGLSTEQLSQVGNNPIYNFTINNGSENISNFGEENFVTITLPYTLSKGEDVDSIAVWYIGDKCTDKECTLGDKCNIVAHKLTSIPATYNNGFVTFKTNHFSYYTVTSLTPEERCALYGHSFVVQNVEGSCTKDAYDLHVCVRCHQKEVKNLVEAKGHDYEINTVKATCTLSGYTQYSCKNCEHEYKIKLNATGHDYAIEEEQNSSCTANGYAKYVCENCDSEYTVTFNKLAHVYEQTVVEASCEEDGYTIHECKNCDYSYTDSFVVAKGHKYVVSVWNWASDYKSASLTFVCENDGEHTLVLDANVGTTIVEIKCSGYSKTTYKATLSYNKKLYADQKVVEVGSAEHLYSTDWFKDDSEHWKECACGQRSVVAVHKFENEQITKQPTCNEDGEKTSTCACGQVSTAVVPATGEHVYEEGRCTTCGKLEGECDHRRLHREIIDCQDLNVCDLIIYYDVCDCGEVKYLDSSRSSISCPIQPNITDRYVDENGNACVVGEGICQECGLKMEILSINSSDNACTTVTTNYYAFSLNGTVIIDEVCEVHSYTNHGQTSDEIINLSQYGACGGSLIVNKCKDCGEKLSFIPNVNCEIDLNNIPEPEQVTDENGYVHSVQTITCADCGLTLYMDAWMEGSSVCEGTYYSIMGVKLGGTVILEISRVEDYDNHQYDYDYEFIGDSCEDGVKIFAQCTVCGDKYTRVTSYHQESGELITIDLSQHSTCGGKIIGRVCEVCKKMVHVDNMGVQCKLNPSQPEQVEKDGVIHFVTKQTCTECGLTFITDQWMVQKSACETIYYQGFDIYSGEVCIYSSILKEVDEQHEHEESYQINGDSCDDGYTVTQSCKKCGDVRTWTGRGHFSEDFDIKFSEYGCCEGYISGIHCKVCKEVIAIYNQQIGCDFLEKEPTADQMEQVVDGNNIVHMVVTLPCSKCNLVCVMDMWTQQISVCETNNYQKMSLYVGEVLVFEQLYVIPQQEELHEYEYSYVLNGESCDDGYEIIKYCQYCGKIERNYDSGHVMEQFSLNLAEHGGCAGSIIGDKCKICNQIFDIQEMQINCNISEVTPDQVIGEDGIVHIVTTQICSDCGLKFVMDSWQEQKYVCVIENHTLMQIYAGDKCIFKQVGVYSEGEHQYQYEYIFKEQQLCHLGYRVIESCAICDYHNEYESAGHIFEMMQDDLSKFGLCGGYAEKHCCKICNTVSRNEIMEYCYWQPIGENTYQCSRCGTVKVESVYYTEKVEMCYHQRVELRTYLKDGQEVYRFENSRWQQDHDNLQRTFKMYGSTCKDGYDVTENCTDCGYNNTYSSNEHIVESRDIDLTQFGLCGGMVTEYKCQACGTDCGSKISANCGWNFVGQNSDGHDEYRCYGCNAVKIVYSVYGAKDENCNAEYTMITKLLMNGEEIFRCEEFGFRSNHDEVVTYQKYGESCEDGYYVITTCKNCNHYEESEMKYDHTRYTAFKLDAEHGCCDDHNVSFMVCPCGQNYDVTYERLSYDEELNAEVCYDCGLTYRTDFDEVVYGCVLNIVSSFEFIFNGEQLYCYASEKEVTNHNFNKFETSVIDGTKMLIVSCDKCNAQKTSKMLSGQMCVNEDGQYYYDYVVTPDDTSEYTLIILNEKYVSLSLYELGENGELLGIFYGNNGSIVSKPSINCKLIAGKTYVYRMSSYDYADESTIDFIFTKGSGDGWCQGHNYYGFTQLLEGSSSCEDGIIVADVCNRCGNLNDVSIRYEHVNSLKEYLNLYEYGACYGEFRLDSCACNQTAIQGFNACANYYTDETYYDNQNRLIHFEKYTCPNCNLSYTSSSYDVKEEQSCKVNRYYTVVIYVGATFVAEFEFVETLVFHEIETTATLLNGEGSTCYDGVSITERCKYCDYEYSDVYYHHYTFEKERFDLSNYGSVCGGYATYNECGCGQIGNLSRDGALCEFNGNWCELFVEDAVTEYQNHINGQTGYNYDSYIYTCAVTDPACAYKIRYARYYLKASHECYAYEYETWQFGYNEETGTFLREVTFKTGSRVTCHNYVKISENGINFDCVDCNSYYHENWYNNENNYTIKYEKIVSNTLDDGNNKYCEHVDEYSVDDLGNSYVWREYRKDIYEDGREYWTNTLINQQDYDGTFGTTGCKIIKQIYNSYGECEIIEYAYVYYKGCQFEVYHYNQMVDGSWERYDYTYTFDNGCIRAERFTNSSGEDVTNYYDCCRLGSHQIISAPTCSQDGLSGYKCIICDKTSDNVEVNGATGHHFVKVNDSWYYCYVCGLENANGVSGEVILEDLTEDYGNGENYVVGYCANTEVEFITHVSLVDKNGDEIAIVDGVEFIHLENVRAFAFSKAYVENWAFERGYSDYFVRFNFVPYSADDIHDYGITFTETVEVGTITGDVSFIDYVDVAEVKEYTITVTENATWTFTSFAEWDTYAEIYDAEGNQLAYDDDSGYYSNFKITLNLNAGETYVVKVKWLNASAYGGKMALLFGANVVVPQE